MQPTKTQLTAKTKTMSKMSLKLPNNISERNTLNSARDPSARFLFTTQDASEQFLSQTIARAQINEDKSPNGRAEPNNNTEKKMSTIQNGKKDQGINDRKDTPVFSPGKNHKSQIINPKLARHVRMPK